MVCVAERHLPRLSNLFSLLDLAVSDKLLNNRITNGFAIRKGILVQWWIQRGRNWCPSPPPKKKPTMFFPLLILYQNA